MRHRTSRFLIASVLAVIVIGIAAFGRSATADTASVSQQTKSSIVPWIDKPASIPTTTTEPIPITCTPNNLKVGSETSGLAMGSAGWNVQVYDIGNTACSLSGNILQVTAINSGGKRISL